MRGWRVRPGGVILSAAVWLGEGNTPLIPSASTGASLGLAQLYFKLESCNPSGSYKDRFIAAEVARLVRLGVRACMATSSGNTGSSLAAYCARYRIRCAIVVNQDAPAGKSPDGQRERGCGDRGQPFWYRAHCQRDRDVHDRSKLAPLHEAERDEQ